jgi:uncharacterized protein
VATTDRIRLVIDPNIIASVLIGGITQTRYLWLLDHIDQFDICYDETLLSEIRLFPDSNYFKKKQITPDLIMEFLADFQTYALKIMVTSSVRYGRDTNDRYLLSLSRDARADYLITGDPDLLKLNRYGLTQIVSMKTFYEFFQ